MINNQSELDPWVRIPRRKKVEVLGQSTRKQPNLGFKLQKKGVQGRLGTLGQGLKRKLPVGSRVELTQCKGKEGGKPWVRAPREIQIVLNALCIECWKQTLKSQIQRKYKGKLLGLSSKRYPNQCQREYCQGKWSQKREKL